MSNQPLAVRLRPTNLSEIVGQDHLIGENKILTRMVNSNTLTSIILYGPPGTGKTSMAHALSGELDIPFEFFNASFHNKKDLENITKKGTVDKPIIVLIDEIHRLTKPIQDFLLMQLEYGSVIMVGATTENPYISLNPAIRSRCHIFELKAINPNDIIERLKTAIMSELAQYKVTITHETLMYLANQTNGDLRMALNTLELAVLSTEMIDDTVTITDDIIDQCIPERRLSADKDGDSHYNLLSAFQKSIRGSDIDASLHYLVRLLNSGDMISVIRRLLVIVYEDIGLANPELTTETFNAISTAERIGLPEARIPLSYITIRLAGSPKSNVSYKAYANAESALKSNRDLAIPLHLHDTHYKDAKHLNKGIGYKYPHDYPFNITDQNHLPQDLQQDRYLTFRDNQDTVDFQKLYHKLNSIIK